MTSASNGNDGVNMNGTSAGSGTDLTQVGSLAVHLTAIRGMVRREPEGVQKQRMELLAGQLERGVPAAMVARQLEVMAGRSRQ